MTLSGAVSALFFVFLCGCGPSQARFQGKAKLSGLSEVSLGKNENGVAVWIESNGLKVAFDSESGSLSISKKGTPFVGKVEFDEALSGEIKVVSIEDSYWGPGRRVLIPHASGNLDTISLFRDLPFVLFQKHQGGHSDSFLNSTTPFCFRLNISGVSWDKLRLNGSCGLRGISKKRVGSYAYMALADPASRRGVVAGWITSERGSGLVFAKLDGGSPVFDARLDYGGWRSNSEAGAALNMFVLGYFDDARIGLERYADAIAKVNGAAPKPEPSVYCSWYHLFRGVRESSFMSNAALAAKSLGPYGLSVAQIDDGWQEGAKKRSTPKKIFLKANSQFPGGMKAVAGKVVETGLTAGLWYMPFAGDADDPWFADKQSLFAMKDGKPFNAKWGGNPFDLSKPEALDFVRNMASTICRKWGYGYIKIDGLWTGMVTRQKYINTAYSPDAFGEAVLSNPAVSHVDAYRRGLRAVREGAGKDVYILGCNTQQNMRTLAASFGLVDGMRIGPDNGACYPGTLRGPIFGGRFYFLHRRVWNNDPDPVYVSSSVLLGDARMLSSWVAVSGQMVTFSEDLSKLPKDRLDMLRHIIPSHSLKPRPADYFSTPCPRIWTLKKGEGESARFVVGYFNWGNGERTRRGKKVKAPGDITVEPCPEDFSYDLKWIGVDPGKNVKVVGYEYWTNKFIAPFAGKLSWSVPSRDARVFSLRPFAGHPVVVSTSRHVTQGVVDIAEEEWDAGKRVLRGKSLVVGGDPYEIRVAAFGPDGKPMECTGVSVSAADSAAGVGIKTVSRDGWKLRLLITSPKSRAVEWRISF
jgi:hypothetical protein